jgi:predicted nuclease of predicted toxin-antitoxin system
VKFIVDAQLPKSLSDFFKEKGYDSIHTLELPERNRTKDSQIIKRSLREKRIIISKDSDFLNSFLLKSEPSKLIMVKTGNIPNKALLKIFNDHFNTIIEMISKSNLVEISPTDIAEQG